MQSLPVFLKRSIKDSNHSYKNNHRKTKHTYVVLMVLLVSALLMSMVTLATSRETPFQIMGEHLMMDGVCEREGQVTTPAPSLCSVTLRL